MFFFKCTGQPRRTSTPRQGRWRCTCGSFIGVFCAPALEIYIDVRTTWGDIRRESCHNNLQAPAVRLDGVPLFKLTDDGPPVPDPTSDPSTSWPDHKPKKIEYYQWIGWKRILVEQLKLKLDVNKISVRN